MGARGGRGLNSLRIAALRTVARLHACGREMEIFDLFLLRGKNENLCFTNS